MTICSYMDPCSFSFNFIISADEYTSKARSIRNRETIINITIKSISEAKTGRTISTKYHNILPLKSGK